MNSAYIIDAVRTPIGKYGGKLSMIRPDDLLAFAIKALLERNPSIDVTQIEDVIAGATNQAGEDCRDIARMAALLVGLPVSVGGNTVNRLCASGMQSVMDAARAIMCGEGMLYIAGGVESMTRAPYVMLKSEGAFTRKMEMIDSTIGWRFTNQKLAKMYHPYNMGETAENIAKQWGISREAQDFFALQSQQKYAAALAASKWTDELIPIPLSDNKEPTFFSKDEQPRSTTLEKLAALKPAFVANGSVTAGNSSAINDGAAALLLASKEAVKLFNLKPLARITSMAIAGVHPDIMGIGPVPATQKALQRAGLKITDMGLTELCESFASQCLACIQDLGIDEKTMNVNGGTIALGNALGSNGTRIIGTLIHEMKRRNTKYGLATMSVGVGQGASMIFEGL
ncbi:thiolase family protein [Parasediminibacterium sp. JCM 36343]|uniref:thiolase family protein n=1 Tax=Parasediminibacterium sp. JCM 36343 TaxID=3374279 RepID=UPI00397D48DC